VTALAGVGHTVADLPEGRSRPGIGAESRVPRGGGFHVAPAAADGKISAIGRMGVEKEGPKARGAGAGRGRSRPGAVGRVRRHPGRHPGYFTGVRRGRPVLQGEVWP